MNISTDRIAELLGCPAENVAANWPLIQRCMETLGIYSDASAIAALATIRIECPRFAPMHELGGDRYFTQLYEGRADLGNLQAGDGARFHGRGFLQITGRANYDRYGRLIGVNLVTDPDAALEPNTAALIFAVYFRERAVNQAAARGDWVKVRRLVNGGTNGITAFLDFVGALGLAMEVPAAAAMARSDLRKEMQ